MSRLVAIEVNPYLNQTHWEIDGVFFKGEGRLSDHMEGRPMSDWLPARRESYKRWDGFLPEIMKELNEDELEFHFIGRQEDYLTFRQALLLQEESVERLGFAAEGYAVCFLEKFAPDGVRKSLRAHREKAKGRASMVPPTQGLLLKMDALDALLFDPAPVTIELLVRLRRGYDEVYGDCASSCEEAKRNSWLNNQSDLRRIFE